MPPWPHLDPSSFALPGRRGDDVGIGGSVGVLLLHGFTGAPTEVRGLGEHLARSGVHVSAPLLPGHGGHHSDLEQTTRHDWLDAAAAALAELQSRCERVVVVGQSMGGLLALSLAARGSARGSAPGSIQGVVALAPALMPARIAWLTHLPLSALGLRYLPKGEERRPDLVDKARLTEVWSNSHTPTRVVPEVLRLAKETGALLAQVTAPLLVVQGARDKTVRPASAHRVLRDAGSVDKELLWLSNSGHIVAVDGERHTVYEHVTSFIHRTTR